MTDQNELFDDLSIELEKMGDDLPPEKSWPGYLRDLYEVTDATLKRHKIQNHSKLANDLIISQAHYLGGRMRYLPTADRLRTWFRNREIWEEFNGRNVMELAKKYQMTDVGIYAIVREQRAIHTKKAQPDLFGDQ